MRASKDDGSRRALWLVFAVFVGAISSTPTQASDAVTGRWAADRASCVSAGRDAERLPLVVTDYAVRWHGDACRIARMYKTGADVHIQAKCWGAGGERSVPVSLRPHAGHLQLRWDHVVSGDLRRCE